MVKVLGALGTAIGVVLAMYGIKMLNLHALITAVPVTALLIFMILVLVRLSDVDEKKSIGSESERQK